MPFDFKKNLTEKLGPLPGYAWVILGVGAVYWYRKSHPSTSILSTNAAAPVANSSTPAVDPSLATQDPTAWANQAAQSLYSSSSWSPDQINQALSALLNGSSLSAQDQAIVNAATSGLGNVPSNNAPLAWGVQQYIDPAGTVFSGGQINSAGAVQGAIDSNGYQVFIPAPGAPQIDPNFVPDLTPGYNNPSGLSGTASNDANSGTAITSNGAPSVPVSPFTPAPTGTFNNSGPHLAPSGGGKGASAV